MKRQYILSIVWIFSVSIICYCTTNLLGYKIVALVLLMSTSLVAILFDIFPVLLTAFLSAIIWNFFFIPPLYTFHINNAEDALMFLLYFVVALVNAVLINKIRHAENKMRDKEEKEKTIKLYNTLLNSLSHELKTPIATILGAVDTLKDDKNRLSILHQEELLLEINKASIRLNQEVENLLNMSRLETGMLTLKKDWCDLNELINGVIQKIDSNNHLIVFNPDDNLPLFKLDEILIEQALYNLVKNAVLYTPFNSVITIHASFTDGKCKIIVEDNGHGFEEHEKELVFNKFYKSSYTVVGGSGLGLSIVKGFIEAHDGRISLENSLQGGARFTIKIPAETSFLNNLKHE